MPGLRAGLPEVGAGQHVDDRDLGVCCCLDRLQGALPRHLATARQVLPAGQCRGRLTQLVLDAVPVSVTFDPSHFVLSGDDIPALVGRWGERIVNVHLKDAFGPPGMDGEDFHFCLLGEGRVPWPELLTALDEVGYWGPLTVEFAAYRYYERILGGDPAAAARLARSQVEALLGEAPEAA